MVAAFSCGIYKQLRWLPRSRACSVAYPAMDGLRRGDRRWLPRSPCIPHRFIHSFIHSFISCAFYSRLHCCVRFNSNHLSSNQSCTRCIPFPFLHSCIRTFIYSVVCLDLMICFRPSFIHSFVRSFIRYVI